MPVAYREHSGLRRRRVSHRRAKPPGRSWRAVFCCRIGIADPCAASSDVDESAADRAGREKAFGASGVHPSGSVAAIRTFASLCALGGAFHTEGEYTPGVLGAPPFPERIRAAVV